MIIDFYDDDFSDKKGVELVDTFFEDYSQDKSADKPIISSITKLK